MTKKSIGPLVLQDAAKDTLMTKDLENQLRLH